MMPQVSPVLLLIFMGLIGAIVGAWIWAILRLAFRLPILPANTPRAVPWGPVSVLAALLVWVASQMVAPMVYRVALAPIIAGAPPAAVARPPGPIAATPGELMTFSAISNVLTLLLVPLALAATSGATRRDFGVGLRGLGRHVGRGLIAYPLLAPLVFGTMLICVKIWKNPTPHPLQDAIRRDQSPRMATILVLAGVVLAPAAEELIFRGVLLGWLTRLALGRRSPEDGSGPWDDLGAGSGSVPAMPEAPPDLIDHDPDAEVTVLGPGAPGSNPYATPAAPIGPMAWPGFEAEAKEGIPRPGSRALPLLAANLIVSLIFATLHGAVWPTPIPIFFLSLGLGLLYQRTGSILGPVALHVTFNGISTLVMFLSLGAASPPKAPSPLPPPASVPAKNPIKAVDAFGRFW